MYIGGNEQTVRVSPGTTTNVPGCRKKPSCHPPPGPINRTGRGRRKLRATCTKGEATNTYVPNETGRGTTGGVVRLPEMETRAKARAKDPSVKQIN